MNSEEHHTQADLETHADPNNTPDFTRWSGYFVRLVRPLQWHVADQAREMGLEVGDVIVGREGGVGGWQEQRLTLLYLGKQCCVWNSEWSNKALPTFRDEGESAGWTLSGRDWYRVNPRTLSQRTAPCNQSLTGSPT